MTCFCLFWQLHHSIVIKHYLLHMPVKNLNTILVSPRKKSIPLQFLLRFFLSLTSNIPPQFSHCRSRVQSIIINMSLVFPLLLILLEFSQPNKIRNKTVVLPANCLSSMLESNFILNLNSSSESSKIKVKVVHTTLKYVFNKNLFKGHFNLLFTQPIER